MPKEGRPTDQEFDQWAEFLTQVPWKMLCTLTYNRAVWSSEKCQLDAHRLIKESTRALARNHYGDHYHHGSFERQYARGPSKGCSPPYILAIEPHKSRALHTHLVLGANPFGEWDPRGMERIWNGQINNAGMSRMSAVRDTKRAALYCEKASRYLTKDAEAVLDFDGIPPWPEDNSPAAQVA